MNTKPFIFVFFNYTLYITPQKFFFSKKCEGKLKDKLKDKDNLKDKLKDKDNRQKDGSHWPKGNVSNKRSEVR
jgi:hypothetical protein